MIQASRSEKGMRAKRSYITPSANETVKLGEQFAPELKKGDIVALKGGLGSGKTTFVQGILNYFGIKKFAKSASFVLVNEYGTDKNRIYHLDLYRLSGKAINLLGMEEYFSKNAITIIEWADKLKLSALRPSFELSFKWQSEQKRKIIVSRKACK